MITQIRINNVEPFKNIVWNLKGKHLAIVYGDYMVNKLLFETLKFLKSIFNTNGIHSGFFSKLNPELEFSLENENYGKTIYKIMLDNKGIIEEKLECTLNQRKSKVFSRKSNGEIFVNKDVFADSESKKRFKMITSVNINEFKRHSIMNLIVDIVSKKIEKSYAAEKILNLYTEINLMKLNAFENVVYMNETDMLRDLLKDSLEGNISINEHTDVLVNPVLLKNVLEQIENKITGQLILFSNTLELMEMKTARENVYFANYNEVICANKFNFRVFKNNNVKNIYLANKFIPIPQLQLEVLLKG